ncbi:MAG TPA: PVC-type heme-binding CxxCH protein [Planctomycetota bacterium]
MLLLLSLLQVAGDGAVVELVAREPDIATPTGLAVDRQGRVWVVENHTHMRPKEYQGPATDRLRLLEDFGPDGRARKISTVAEGFQHSMNLAIGGDGDVLLVTRNALLKVPGGPLVRLETVGDYPHNGLFGLAFDARGDVYFALGRNTGKDHPLGAPWTLIGSDGSRISGTEGGRIFRCKPDGSALAPVASGFWNTYHLAFDPAGRLFAVDNDPGAGSESRLLHIVDGGDYGFRPRAGYRDAHPFISWNGERVGTLPAVAFTGEAPAGLLADEPGSLLVTSWGDHRVERYRLVPRGTSFTARAETMLKGGDDFRPVGIARAPDGSIFLSDWVDRSYPVHGKGRIWRVRVKADVRKSPGDFRTSPDPFAVAAEIAELAKLGTEELLKRDVPRLTILAALRRKGERDPALVKRFLDDPDPAVRREAIQWAAEEGLADLDLAAAAARAPTTADLFETYLGAMEYLSGRRDRAARETQLARILEDPSQPALFHAAALRRLRLPVPEIVAWLESPGVRLEAVRALVDAGAEEALKRAAADPELRLEAVAGLSSRPFLEALRDVPRGELLRSLGEAVAEPIGAEDVKAPGDPAAGERLFFHPRGPRCGLCHRVAGRGGAVGPDLSRVSRAMDRERLAESIVEPSKEVAPEYVAWDVTTRDGDTWIGRILRDDVATVTMLLASGQTIQVKRADIAHRRPCQVSLMPEGLQRALTRKEFRDLLAFLGSLK